MGEGERATVGFRHDGVDWEIPVDLVQLQRAWYAADAECQALAEGEDLDALKAARTRRLELTMQLHDDPWLLQAMADGRRHQADMALKACARAASEG